MVVHLLVLGRVVPHQCTARQHQVGACRVQALVDEEVLLFPAQVGDDLLHAGVEVSCYCRCRLVDSMDGTLQRCLVVEGFSRIRNEDSRNTECVVDDEYRRGGVPCRVAACLEGGTYAAVGERRGVRFLLYQQLTAELLNHATLAVVLDEGVMLLGGALREGLEPVGVVGDAVLVSPLLHALGYGIGDGAVEWGTVVDDIDEFLVHVALQVLVHLCPCEHVLGKELRRAFGGFCYLKRLLLESLFYNLES